MNVYKLENVSDRVCEIMTVLSNRNRFMILCHLAMNEKSVRELANLLSVRETVISQHLAILRKSDIVEATRHRQSMYYKIICDDSRNILEFLYATYRDSPTD